MVTRIKVSSKGQIALPKRTRDRLGIANGTELDMIETADGVELRLAKHAGLAADEAIERLRRIVRYQGPRVPIEELSWYPDADGDPA